MAGEILENDRYWQADDLYGTGHNDNDIDPMYECDQCGEEFNDDGICEPCWDTL